jgi:hypothetical protein
MSDDASEFAHILINHAKGRAHDEATKLLRDAVEAVKNTGKPADVTVKLSIHPVKNNSSIVRIEDKVTSTVPKEPRSSVWFPDDFGALHRNDPTQLEIWENDRADGKSAAAGKDN